MGASNQPETLVLRARTTIAEGSLSVTPPDGYVVYPEGDNGDLELTVTLTSTGVTTVKFPRLLNEQEDQVIIQATDGDLVQLKRAYTNTITDLGGVAPEFDTLTISTYDAATGTVPTNANLEIRIARARVLQADG